MKPPALQLHSRGFLYIPGKKSPYTPDSPSALFKMQRILGLMKVKFSTVLIRFRQDGQMLCTLLHTASQCMCAPRDTSDHPSLAATPLLLLHPEPLLLLYLTYHRSLLLHAWSDQAPGVPEQLATDLLPPFFSVGHSQSTKGQTACQCHCHSPPAAS